MKVNAIIVEDEYPARQTIKSYLKRYFPFVVVSEEIDTIDSAREVLKEKSVDVLFLDVQLKDGLGTELIDIIKLKNIRVVFTTAYEEYTVDAFKSKAFGYLLKPIDPDDFKEILNRVIKDIAYLDHSTRKIKVPTNKGGSALIEVNRIIRCEANSNYTRIIYDTSEVYLIAKTLKAVELELLRENYFVRAHHSHLININYVDQQAIKHAEIKMTNGDNIPISRSKRDALFAELEKINR